MATLKVRSRVTPHLPLMMETFLSLLPVLNAREETLERHLPHLQLLVEIENQMIGLAGEIEVDSTHMN